MVKRYLLLENGSIYSGQGFGSLKKAKGELVFNTGMTGYQETITDPSY
ncbi:carbamoyl-phosphate synthase domain-containing protein, partial [Oenococcus oeni]